MDWSSGVYNKPVAIIVALEQVYVTAINTRGQAAVVYWRK